MDVSLSFSQGDNGTSAQGLLHFSVAGMAKVRRVRQTSPGLPEQLHHRKLHTQTLLQWGHKGEQGFGEGAKTGAVGTSSASIGQIQHL